MKYNFFSRVVDIVSFSISFVYITKFFILRKKIIFASSFSFSFNPLIRFYIALKTVLFVIHKQ